MTAITKLLNVKRLLARLMAWQLIGSAFSIACALCSGCTSSAYLQDRLHDGADIFTATVGKGIGAQTRVGPLHAGFVAVGDKAGLRGGALHPLSMSSGPGYIDSGAIGGDYSLGVYGFEYLGMTAGKSAGPRGKDFQTMYLFVPTDESFKGGKSTLNPAYWSQIEVVVAAGLSLRVGFNPGELLDFILGWATIDIYGDDLGGMKRSSSQEKPLSKGQEASLLNQIELNVGMDRQKVEEQVAKVLSRPNQYSPYGNNLTGGIVQYPDGDWVLEVKYKAGSPGPLVKTPDGKVQGYPPVETHGCAWAPLRRHARCCSVTCDLRLVACGCGFRD